MFQARPKALYALANRGDSGIADFALGLEPVKVEEPAISSVQDLDPLWQVANEMREYGSNEDCEQGGCDNASLNEG